MCDGRPGAKPAEEGPAAAQAAFLPSGLMGPSFGRESTLKEISETGYFACFSVFYAVFYLIA